MDIELYVSDKVDKLGLSLNFRQRNFLEGLLLEAYTKGNELAHSVMGKGIFESQAVPFLKDALEPLVENPEDLEKLSIGDWVGVINTNNLLHNLRDRFFSRNATYTHREDLQLHDLVEYENQIAHQVMGLTEEGLLAALEEWCQNRMMGLAGDKLNEETVEPLKTNVPKPLVNHDAEAGIDWNAKRLAKDLEISTKPRPGMKKKRLILLRPTFKDEVTIEEIEHPRIGSIPPGATIQNSSHGAKVTFDKDGKEVTEHLPEDEETYKLVYFGLTGEEYDKDIAHH